MLEGYSKDEETLKVLWAMLRNETPDELVARFLRARGMHIEKALHMIQDTMKWRMGELQVDQIIFRGERGAYADREPGFIKNLELRKALIIGKDKDRRPVVYVRPKLHFSSDQTEAEINKYALLVIEQSRLFMEPGVETVTILFDMKGFSLSNMDYGPVQLLIKYFERHYPESLGHLIIHKSPWLFKPIWSIIKRWLDPVVAAKVCFTQNSNDLQQFFETEILPEELSGNVIIDEQHFPIPDGTDDKRLTDIDSKETLRLKRTALIDKFLSNTQEWLKCDSPIKDSEIQAERLQISQDLVLNYRQLDQYIRSRSTYDVNGMLKLHLDSSV